MGRTNSTRLWDFCALGGLMLCAGTRDLNINGRNGMISKLLTGLAASALVAAPIAASAAPATSAASKLSVTSSARASTPTGATEKVAGVGIIPAILAAAIVAGGIFLIVDDDDDSDSN